MFGCNKLCSCQKTEVPMKTLLVLFWSPWFSVIVWCLLKINMDRTLLNCCNWSVFILRIVVTSLFLFLFLTNILYSPPKSLGTWNTSVWINRSGYIGGWILRFCYTRFSLWWFIAWPCKNVVRFSWHNSYFWNYLCQCVDISYPLRNIKIFHMPKM